MFSSRTNWHREQNRLTEALEARRRAGGPVCDLTASNPTECGLTYPNEAILSSLAQPGSLQYRPDPRGLLSARQAVAAYYGARQLTVDPSRIVLTAGTSEAYGLLFRLLCNAGEAVLVPQPSYPLFEYLAQIADVGLQQYQLAYDHEWTIDRASLRDAITPATRAIVMVNPHNPTGMFLRREEHRHIAELARAHRLALIVDEVFIDYPFAPDPRRLRSTAGEGGALTFTLNGISKALALPQMKLGWIAVSGPEPEAAEAMERLDILCDTFLTVNSAVQIALPSLFAAGRSVHHQVLGRITANDAFLRDALRGSSCTVLASEGGWYAVLRVPATRSDEEWALELLTEEGVYLFPGYFFDLQKEGYLVVSLLPDPGTFRAGVAAILRRLSAG
jgi:alanine-synthesizing transaminase